MPWIAVKINPFIENLFAQPRLATWTRIRAAAFIDTASIEAQPDEIFRRLGLKDYRVDAGVESAGIFSIAFCDEKHGVIVGGDYRKPDATRATTAVTDDGGKTWKLVDKRLPYRSGVARAR